MNKEDLLLALVKEKLNSVNYEIKELNEYLNEFYSFDYDYELLLEKIDCSTLKERKSYNQLSICLKPKSSENEAENYE